MARSKKGNSWEELSSAFDDTETRPRKKKKIEITENEIFLKKSSVLGIKKKKNIHNLSKLVEACEPKQLSELSVSKQKQKEIGDWFEEQFNKNKPKILILSGPSGCGKTVALKIIAKDHGYDVVEWTTPTDNFPCDNSVSTRQSDKFFDFLIRTTRYNSVFQNNSKRLLLVKDLPNLYSMKNDLFVDLLENYFQYGKEPLIFIFTDGGSSKMVKTLFPATVRDKFDIDQISINSTTQAAMKNMLKRVAVILNTQGSDMIDVKQENIDEVLSNNIGDVRSAILNLIFNSLKVPDKEGKHDCESREESLGLLHAIGRVINPKRIKSDDDWKFVHDPDDIASYFQSQSSIFLHFLYENYMNTMSKIEEIELCADILSLSDVITYEWRDPNLSLLNLSFCIRGVMVNNKNPVSGWNPVRKPRSDEIKISRNLGNAEERWYRSIIRPQENREIVNSDNTIIEENSD